MKWIFKLNKCNWMWQLAIQCSCEFICVASFAHTVPPPLQQREKKHLADFLEEYDDSKDDQKYYRGSAFARRRREREVEMEEDERDRIREKKEIESLRLKVSCVEVLCMCGLSLFLWKHAYKFKSKIINALMLQRLHGYTCITRCAAKCMANWWFVYIVRVLRYSFPRP